MRGIRKKLLNDLEVMRKCVIFALACNKQKLCLHIITTVWQLNLANTLAIQRLRKYEACSLPVWGVDSSFLLFLDSGFARTLLPDKWRRRFTPLFVFTLKKSQPTNENLVTNLFHSVNTNNLK